MLRKILALLAGILPAALLALIYSLFPPALQPSHTATTLLPNGQQCFQTAAGPVSSGSVNMYLPNTTTPKATWKDSAQASQNTQPIQLDANGCAIIYGVGQYRQQLFTGPVVGGATSGTLVFDLNTTDTSAFNSTFWAATAGGTVNAITVVDTGFNATDGSVVNFTALFTNTSGVTINPSGFGAIQVLKDTTTGAAALTGGEITAANVISVIYRASDNAFHILNPVIQSATTSNAPLCGASGYVAQNDATFPNTEIDIVATDAVTNTTLGASIHRTNISLVLNAAVNGANGLDTGALANSTSYYVWLIDNGISPASLLSLSSTSPTLPGGYTYKCRVGAWRVGSGGALIPLYQSGNVSLTTGGGVLDGTSAVAGNCSTATPGTFVTTKLPATATAASLFVSVNDVNSMFAFGGPAAGAQLAGAVGVAGISLNFQVTVPMVTPGTIYYCNDNTANALDIEGWTDSVNVR